jgi:hypothetical protein
MGVPLPVAEVMHAMPGRTRLRVHDRRGDTAFFSSAASARWTFPGVYKVETRPLTGSVLIAHFSSLERIGDAACNAGLFTLNTTGAAPATEDGTPFDPKLLVVFSLVGLALWQLSRDRAIPPALTLLWYASQLGGLWRPQDTIDGK